MKKLSLLILFIIINQLVIFSQNNALVLDGSNDYVDCGSNSSLNITDNTITIEAWIYPEDFKSGFYQSTICGNDGWTVSTSEGYVFRYGGSNGDLDFTFASGGDSWKSTTASGVLLLNTWQHVAAVYNGSTVKLYVNGVEKYSKSFSSNIPSSSKNLNIGNSPGDIYKRLMNGKIDEFRIWDDARTVSEIRNNMYQELNGTESDLVAYYKFNETSGTSLDDASVNNNDGTLTNMSGSEWETSPAMFGPKNCLDFDGNNDYITVGNQNELQPSSSFTLEAMVYIDGSPDDYSCIIDNGYATSGIGCGGYNLGVYDGKFFAWACTGTSYPSDRTVISSGKNYSTGKWNHIAVVYNGSALTMYINGHESANASMSGSINYTYLNNSSSYGLNIGIFNDDNETYQFDGNIDEVRIWNIARTTSQIRENMYKSLTANESGLVAYYNFDNCTGSTLQDFSGNGNDGTLTNMDNSDWVSSAAFNTWLNTSSTSWATSSNWSRGAIPVSTDNVGIYSLSGSDPIIIGTPTINNMYVESGATVSVSSDFTVNNNLILDENLNMNGNIVNIGSDGKLIENNGLLCGCSGYSCHTQTLDNISCLNIAGLGAEITTTANMGSTDVYRYHTAITGPTGDEGINRFYKILPTTNTGLNATLVFHYDDSELNGCTESNLVLFKSTNNGQTWSQVGGTINTTDNTITLSSIDGFSWWTAAEGGSTLPIELINFEGIYANKQIELNWQTASEINNESFILERSENGTNFSKIAEIPGSDNSNGIVKYNYYDLNVERNQIYYYKLSDRSFNGKVIERKTIYVSTGTKYDNISYQVFPNPFSDNLNIIINGKHDYIKIKLLNSSGLEVVNIFEGKTTKYGRYISWNCFDKNQQKIAKGIYFLEIETNGGIKIEKLILR